MPVLSLQPATATDPAVIPPPGAAVRFTVTARCPTGAQEARFAFVLKDADGYRWSSGGTAVERTTGIDDQWRDYSFTLTLNRAQDTGARLLLIRVTGVLTAGGAAKTSSAMLTVSDTLGNLMAAHRAENGQTQSELAELLEVSPSWVGKLEGGANPSVELLGSLKNVLEVQG